MMNLEKFQWIGYFHFTGEHEVTFFRFSWIQNSFKIAIREL